MALRTLCGICLNGTSEAARVSAAALLLERGWGRPPQSHTGEDGDRPIVVEIVYHNLDEQMRTIELPALEHVPGEHKR
jgi:hypothetical protein